MDFTRLFELLASYAAVGQTCDLLAVLFGPDTQSLATFQRGLSALRPAQNFQRIVFTHCPSEQMLAQFKARNGSVVLFKPFDEGRHDLDPGFTEAAFVAFLKKYAYPLVVDLGEKGEFSLVSRNLPCLFLFKEAIQEKVEDAAAAFPSQSLLERALIDKTLNALAMQFRGRLQVVVVKDVSKGPGLALAQQVKLSAHPMPAVCLVEVAAPFRQYQLLGDLYPKRLVEFVEDWAAGALKPVGQAVKIGL